MRHNFKMNTVIYNVPTDAVTNTEATNARALGLFRQMQEAAIRHTDTIFGWLMICQWLAAIAAAVLISPRAWAGTQSHIHIHVLAAIVLGGIITALPVLMAFGHPGKV